MSGAGPFLSLPAGYSILGRTIVAPPVVAVALQGKIVDEMSSWIEVSLLVDANHCAFHRLPVQLSVVVDLHGPGLQLRLVSVIRQQCHLAASALLMKVTSACPGLTILARLSAPMSPNSSKMSS